MTSGFLTSLRAVSAAIEEEWFIKQLNCESGPALDRKVLECVDRQVRMVKLWLAGCAKQMEIESTPAASQLSIVFEWLFCEINECQKPHEGQKPHDD